MVLPPLLKGVEGGKETERDRKTERGKKKKPLLATPSCELYMWIDEQEKFGAAVTIF